MNNKKEYIICAAMHWKNNKHYDHQPKNIKSGLVVCGRRHCNCFVILKEIQPDLSYKTQIDQGFLTNTNRFVNRKEAAKIAYVCDQIKEENNCLMSEDLY